MALLLILGNVSFFLLDKVLEKPFFESWGGMGAEWNYISCSAETEPTIPVLPGMRIDGWKCTWAAKEPSIPGAVAPCGWSIENAARITARLLRRELEVKKLTRAQKESPDK